MKPYFIIELLIFSLFVTGCQKDESLTDQRAMHITVQYEDLVGIHADPYAKVYIYYGVYSADIVDFSYTSDGVLVHKDQKILPDISLDTDETGTLTTTVDNSKKITILIESIRTGMYTTYSFSPGKYEIKCTFTFKQDTEI